MNTIKNKLIAPCGMNCALCMAYLRKEHHCSGCLYDDSNKPKYCVTCVIKNCKKRVSNNWKYCFECDTFPCARLKRLDKRYRTKYDMSMIENLEYIRDHGIGKFIKNEKSRWIKNDKVYCVHRKEYY